MKFCKGVKYWENLLELLVYQTLKKVFMISYAISIHDRQTDRQTKDFLYQYQYSTAVLTCDKEPSDLCWTMQHLSAACAALSTTSTGNQMAYVTYAFFYNFRYMMYNSNMLCRFFLLSLARSHGQCSHYFNDDPTHHLNLLCNTHSDKYTQYSTQ